jgi:predicted Zn-dependent protease
VTRPASSTDDGLFEEIFEAAAHGAAREGEGAELYERRGAALEVSEDEDGTRVLVSNERGFALRLIRNGRVAFAAATPDAAEGSDLLTYAEDGGAPAGSRASRASRSARG